MFCYLLFDSIDGYYLLDLITMLRFFSFIGIISLVLGRDCLILVDIIYSTRFKIRFYADFSIVSYNKLIISYIFRFIMI